VLKLLFLVTPSCLSTSCFSFYRSLVCLNIVFYLAAIVFFEKGLTIFLHLFFLLVKLATNSLIKQSPILLWSLVWWFI